MAETRVDRWKRKLLDLSLRNRLLNCRDGKQILPLECADVAKLEDGLAKDAAVQVSSALPPGETAKRLKEIHRAGRTAIEESGVNSVFAAVGFLEWKEADPEAKARRAPILLIPVRLERASAASAWRMVRIDEDAHVNTTLVEFLRAEFGISVADIDPLPQDDSGTDVAAVFAAFEMAVAPKGWTIVREAALGYFSFGKIVLWKDLTSRLDDLKRNPLVAHLIESGGTYDDGVAVFPQEEVARHIDPSDLFCPLGADASQLAAVLYSALGKTFVLHGPPGTGKSQTITNLIVHNLAHGKRVLFVSEKKVALDVVHRRLCSAGVGPFCLELHSNKSGKGHVLAQFAEALAVPPSGAPSGMAGVCHTLDATRKELAAYVAALHKTCPNGLSAYDCLTRAHCTHPAASANLVSARCSVQDRAAADDLARRAEALAAEWAGVDAEAYSALAPVIGTEWSPEKERDAVAAIDALVAALSAEEQGGFVAKLKRWWRSFLLRKVVVLPFSAKPAQARERLEAARGRIGDSRIVFAYRVQRQAAVGSGLRAFADAMEKGVFPPSDASRVFADSYAAKTLSEILSAEKALSTFAGLRQEERIRAFREADKLFAEAVKKSVFARLAARLPEGRGDDCPEKSELGLLKRECTKKARQKPVRQLLADAKGVVGRLKPCFLMSPLSVSQYLPPDAEQFDIVVFDEASQIPVWDAVGVIARGRQAVIVGDPKQMPPTNFFQKGEGAAEDEDDDGGVEDMESILDESLALGIHSAYLDWHYRSRHESLIAFSNAHYYEDRLNTFPAAKRAPGYGVSMHFVEGGVYDARSSRTNAKEAEAIADWVFAEASRPDARSVGVVTFSIAQKNLIEDILEKRAAEDPSTASFFDESREDPFFVKNLENVQGDERDVILFSVGYAPDSKGDFAMNFGPLNREGGERRLNVAVTRARREVVVFSSIHAEQIDISRTKAVGAAHLKDFLDYAARGGETRSGAASQAEAPIAEAAEFLRANGYSVALGVGASNKRVDLAVMRPGAEGEYMLGILGDGPAYGADATVRDRDALRIEVLQSLGWNVMRLWSVDWALDRSRSEKRILETLERLKANPAERFPDAVKASPEELKRILKPLPPPGRGRPASAPANRRQVETVPVGELRAMRDDIVMAYGKCPADVIYKEISRRLGYATLSPKARAHLQAVLPC